MSKCPYCNGEVTKDTEFSSREQHSHWRNETLKFKCNECGYANKIVNKFVDRSGSLRPSKNHIAEYEKIPDGGILFVGDDKQIINSILVDYDDFYEVKKKIWDVAHEFPFESDTVYVIVGKKEIEIEEDNRCDYILNKDEMQIKLMKKDGELSMKNL